MITDNLIGNVQTGLVQSSIGENFSSYIDSIGPFLNTFAIKADVLYSSLIASKVLYILLGFILAFGTVNWTVWLIRRTRSIFYKPVGKGYMATTSVVIPVYKEDLNILKSTVDSILKNEPDEVILMLDHTEEKAMKFLQATYGRRVKPHFIYDPGKRPALAEGIRLAKGEIVVLVDSDTQWTTKDFLENLLAPFRDPKVGGVGTRQRVSSPKSWGHRVIDWNLDLKYTDYAASDSMSGSVLCLSGRTAAYRRSIVLPLLPKLVNEYFLWHKCLGGDDTRLTSLVLKSGYKTVFQGTSVAKSVFEPSFGVYLKQKVRWSRNSYRAYLKAIFGLWPWRQGRLYYLMSAYHTVVPGLSLFISIAFLGISIYLQAYLFVYIWVAWAVISRLIKSYSHLRKRPVDIFLLPVVVLYYYLLSFIKLYAFLTLTKESWSGSRKSYRIRNGVRLSKEATSK